MHVCVHACEKERIVKIQKANLKPFRPIMKSTAQWALAFLLVHEVIWFSFRDSCKNLLTE